MKILVFSDSHRMISNMSDVIAKIHGNISHIIHLGDNANDISAFENQYKKIKFYSVTGNSDWGNTAENSMLFSISGKRFFITHGHLFGVKSQFDRISYKAMEKEADVCLFGHTHCPTIFDYENITFMNPGSISLPRNSPICSYGIIDISDNGIVHCEVVGIEKDTYRILNI